MQGGFGVPGFQVQGLVSASPTGEVWQARHEASGDHVALKRVRIPHGPARDEAKRIVSILGLIGHPHLLRIREAIPLDEEVVFVLDYADGGSLAELLSARGPLDPAEVVTTIAPIAEALAAAHERGLVHGDVTPDHILYTGDGRPVLADLGLLSLIEGGEALRTHGYFDESSSAQSSTPPGDVYALAVCAATALTGEPPKAGTARQPLAEQRKDLPPGLVHAVEAGLQPLAPRRPTAGQLSELVYAACPPAPIRFPVGLVLTDADLAKMAEQAKAAEAQKPPQPPGQQPPPGPPPAVPGNSSEQDPFVHNLGGGPAPGPQGPPGPPGPPRPPGHRPPPGGFESPDSIEDFDAELIEAGRRRRRLIIGAAILGPILIAVAIVAGLAWAKYAGPVDPPTITQPETTPSVSAEPSATPSASTSPSPEQTPTFSPEPLPTVTSPLSPVPTTTTPPTPGATAGPDARWRSVLNGLDTERARAFAGPDIAPLSRVYIAGSELLAKDRTEVDKCVKAGCKLEGLRFDIKNLVIVSETATQTVLDVVDQLQPYTVVQSSGERNERPAGAVTSRRITLVQQPGAGWLISRIEQR
ncbi:serine/threonine protein kinase [Tenggerimyces flavus]|uniref:Serine/threonine protein kinase n=1 Tax=Tenggerimyces flavus TaxID=1708749 RepID=A0ABV7YLY0_9ACTN|nr:protein kinase [Tenggerimyces flavus]MBM7788773.1 serine/threonine protein kinase [Tenggerimyces flavus]